MKIFKVILGIVIFGFKGVSFSAVADPFGDKLHETLKLALPIVPTPRVKREHSESPEPKRLKRHHSDPGRGTRPKSHGKGKSKKELPSRENLLSILQRVQALPPDSPKRVQLLAQVDGLKDPLGRENMKRDKNRGGKEE